jgi:hypothetical protein
MVTGIGHEKLNVFHRYVGWMMFLLGTIHTIPFFVQLNKEGGITAVKEKFYSQGAMEVSRIEYIFPVDLIKFFYSIPVSPAMLSPSLWWLCRFQSYGVNYTRLLYFLTLLSPYYSLR